jgi:hypothetical protein
MAMKIKRIGLGLLGVLLLIQLIPADRPEVIMNNPNDLILNNEIPGSIEKMLVNSCYDCHSNETAYPWYAYIAPVSFLVSKDTKEGRRELNFSQWEKLDGIEKAEMLEEIAEEVEEGEMPMKIYPITHPDARLSDEDRETIKAWALTMALEEEGK